jgi:hypothetical protein
VELICVTCLAAKRTAKHSADINFSLATSICSFDKICIASNAGVYASILIALAVEPLQGAQASKRRRATTALPVRPTAANTFDLRTLMLLDAPITKALLKLVC